MPGPSLLPTTDARIPPAANAHLMLGPSLLLTTGADGRWHPGIGDPTPMGWITVLAYLAASALAFRAFALRPAASPNDATAGSSKATQLRRLRWFWLLAAVVLLVLGINKQLDLQTWFTQTLRDLSHAQGWYGARRRYQLAFILAVLISGAAATGLIAYALRRVLHRVRGAVVGLGLVVAFVVMRAASFHSFDWLIMTGPIRLNWVLELSGILLLGTSAWRYVRGSSEAVPGRPLQS